MTRSKHKPQQLTRLNQAGRETKHDHHYAVSQDKGRPARREASDKKNNCQTRCSSMWQWKRFQLCEIKKKDSSWKQAQCLEVFVYTPHRVARTLHTVSRARLHTHYFPAFGSMMHCDAKCVTFKTIVRRSRASCLILTRRGLIFHLFLFFITLLHSETLLTVMNNHLIHAQQDGLVDLPYKVLLHFLSRSVPTDVHVRPQQTAPSWRHLLLA